MRIETRREYCYYCGGEKLRTFERTIKFSPFQFIINFLMFIHTLGLWIFIWIFLGNQSYGEWKCTRCGNPWHSKERAEYNKATRKYNEGRKLAKALGREWKEPLPVPSSVADRLVPDPRNNPEYRLNFGRKLHR